MKFITLITLMFSLPAFARTLYEVKENAINGQAFNFSSMKDKVVLVVNIASQCGYTKQLGGLEKLQKQYKDKPFVVLGVPTNDFGGQTPEDDKGMQEFCKKNYDVTFPLLNKKTVKGKEKRDLYKYLTEESPKDLQGNIDWNFVKFLINKKGAVVSKFGSNVEPSDSELIQEIDKLLK